MRYFFIGIFWLNL